MMTVDKIMKKRIREIENHLRHYRTYKTGISNIQKKLDYLMPGITATYEVREGSTGAFVFTTNKDSSPIDRIESKRVLDLYEEMNRDQMIVDAIEKAVQDLPEIEQDFIEKRYFHDYSIAKLSFELGYSERSIFKIRKQVMDKLLISLGSLVKD